MVCQAVLAPGWHHRRGLRPYSVGPQWRDSQSLYFLLWPRKWNCMKTRSFYFSSRIAACTLALSSGVTSRIPCCLACSMAFFRTSSSVFPRTTCLHPDEGSTLAHSMTLPMVEAPFCSPVRCEVDRGTRDKEA